MITRDSVSIGLAAVAYYRSLHFAITVLLVFPPVAPLIALRLHEPRPLARAVGRRHIPAGAAMGR